MAYLAKKNAPLRFTPSCRSHCAELYSGMVPGTSIPALLTRMSSRPSSAIVRSTAARTCSSLDTSPSNGSALPRAQSPAAVRRAPSPSISKITTAAPPSTNRSAMPAPIPFAPPVTSATKLSSCMQLLSHLQALPGRFGKFQVGANGRDERALPPGHHGAARHGAIVLRAGAGERLVRHAVQHAVLIHLPNQELHGSFQNPMVPSGGNKTKPDGAADHVDEEGRRGRLDVGIHFVEDGVPGAAIV